MARSLLSKAFWTLASLGGIWAIFIGSLLNPTIQRHVLYLHRFNTLFYDNLDAPESFGFAQGQVEIHNITTADSETLYAWHVLPLASYKPATEYGPSQTEWAFDSPVEECRLIIAFHGNAGHLAQGWRVSSYKTLPTANPHACTRILAFDYRGFGKSSGFPTEAGLIEDGMAVVRYAIDVLKYSPDSIALLGHSLGTAVVAAVADRWASEHEGGFDFAGMCLVAGFSDIPTLVKTYAIGGIIPILSPLNMYPRLQVMLSQYFVDTWDTSERLTRLAGGSENLRLHVFHAQNDFGIGWKHSDALFDAAVAGLNAPPIRSISSEAQFGFSREKTFTRVTNGTASYTTMSDFSVKRTILRYGGKII